MGESLFDKVLAFPTLSQEAFYGPEGETNQTGLGSNPRSAT